MTVGDGDPRFEAMAATAYARIFDQHESDEATVEHLIDVTGENNTLAEMAVAEAYLIRHRQALACELSYEEWLGAVVRKPMESGRAVAILTILSVPVTFAVGVFILKLLPAGNYPQFVLWLPFIGAGLAFFFLASIPVYRRTHRKAIAERNGPAGGFL